MVYLIVAWPLAFNFHFPWEPTFGHTKVHDDTHSIHLVSNLSLLFIIVISQKLDEFIIFKE